MVAHAQLSMQLFCTESVPNSITDAIMFKFHFASPKQQFKNKFMG